MSIPFEAAETNEQSPSPIHCHDAQAVDRTSMRRHTSSIGGMKRRRLQRSALPRGKDYHAMLGTGTDQTPWATSRN